MNAQFNLGALHTTGRGVEKSDEEAAKWFSAAAAQGDVQAQEQLERIDLRRTHRLMHNR